MSNVALFDPEVVIERLEQQVTALRRVTGAADLVSAREDLKQAPSAFVVPLTSAPGRNSAATTVVMQRVTEGFGVVLAVKNLRDTTGREAHKELRALRIAVITALLGWTPEPELYDPLELGPGRLLVAQDRELWWQDDWRTVCSVRST